MSRLPDLERALLKAATDLDHQESPAAAPPPLRRHARRWRRRSTPLLAGLASLLVAGGAIAAVSGLLSDGDPVPAAPGAHLKPAAPNSRFELAKVRVPDPDGGPMWGIGAYTGIASADPGIKVPPQIASRFRQPVTCVVIGRVQSDQLGVVGRDGVFHNDGRFHHLSPASQAGSMCGGRARDGSLVLLGFGPPIPASGYTGAPGTPIGGCRERVNLDGPTVSMQTRRKLNDVPQCARSGLRQVIAGFAGPRAATVTLIAAKYRKTVRVDATESGAFLFVHRSTSTKPPHLRITDRTGRTCDAFARSQTANPQTHRPVGCADRL